MTWRNKVKAQGKRAHRWVFARVGVREGAGATHSVLSFFGQGLDAMLLSPIIRHYSPSLSFLSTYLYLSVAERGGGGGGGSTLL